MTHRVGRYVFGDPRQACVFADHPLNAAGAEASVIATCASNVVAAIAEEKRWEVVEASSQVFVDAFGGRFGNKHGTVFLAFPAYHKLAAGRVHMVAVQPHEFRNT